MIRTKLHPADALPMRTRRAPGSCAVMAGVVVPPAGPDLTLPTPRQRPLTHTWTDKRLEAGTPMTLILIGSETDARTTGASAGVSPTGLVTRTTGAGAAGAVDVVLADDEPVALDAWPEDVITGCWLTTCTEDCGAPEPDPLLLGGVETGRVGPGREHVVVEPETTS